MLWLLLGPSGFACWITFALVFGFVCCWVLVFALSPFSVLVCVFWGGGGAFVGWGLSCGPGVCESWSASVLGAGVGAPFNRFKPSSKIFLLTFPGRCFFLEHLCYFCLVFFVHSCAFVCRCLVVDCWGWPLGSRLWCLIVTLSFSHCILGQVWYLIVSIPDLCYLSYLNIFKCIQICLRQYRGIRPRMYVEGLLW